MSENLTPDVASGDPVETPPVAPPPPPKRGPGHRGQDIRDTVAEMAAKAHEISLEAGSKMASAMRDVVGAAAGLSAFAIESARDLVNYMVRRGQMSQEEATKLLREVEEAHGKRPKFDNSPKPIAKAKEAAPKAVAAPKVAAKPAEKAVAKPVAPAKPAAKPAAKAPAPVAKAAPKPAAKAAPKPAAKAPAKPVAKKK